MRYMSENPCTLLVDNSNTFTKFALWDEAHAQPMEVRALPTLGLTVDSIRALVHGWLFRRVAISSVVAESRAALQVAFRAFPVSWISASAAEEVFSQYAGAATLGADRVANVLAVAEYGRFPAVAVDMGTAATFDVVGNGPRFLGGIIAPGQQMMADAMHRCTSLLPRVPQLSAQPGCIGGNTVEAMLSGARLAFEGMVELALRSLAGELGTRPFVVATGGCAGYVAEHVQLVDMVDEHLTLKGIAVAARRGGR